MRFHISAFTMDEKIRLLAGRSDNWHTEDFGGKLPSVFMSDGPIGLRTPVYSEKGEELYDSPAVAYPDGQVLSQTWDPTLAYEMGTLLADDCVEKGVDVLLGPGVNIKRDPICGRNFEYFSEDPYVSGVFGREYIRGLQDNHISATLKHYCCNNLEYGRLWVSSEVDERTLREVYVRPFEIAMEAKPHTVMSSYNAVNGVKVSQHKKLNDLLRNTLGFDGLLMSDWGAVVDHAASVKSGVDLEMPYSQAGYEQLKAAVESGEVTEAEIDACVRRVLDLVELCQENRPKRSIKTTADHRRKASQRIAEEGIVLLKNNGVLPLKADARVSISGGAATDYICGAGSSRVRLQDKAPTLKSCLEQVMPGAVFTHDSRYSFVCSPWDCVPDEAIGKDAALVCVGTEDSEGGDRPCGATAASGIRLPEVMEELILRTARLNPNTVVVLYCGAAIDMTRWIDKVAGVVWAGYCGEWGQKAVANILSGKVNPSGKLTETFPLDETYTSAAQCYRDSMVNVYSDGLLVGYRWHDMQKFLDRPSGVQFPFGHGLSYSQFTYSDLEIDKQADKVLVRFQITNTSSVDGKEAAQVYIRHIRSKVFHPKKELKAFQKVFVPASGRAEVEIELTKDAFSYYSVATDGWSIETGECEILIAASAEDIRLSNIIQL